MACPVARRSLQVRNCYVLECVDDTSWGLINQVMSIAQMSDVSGSVGSPWVHEQMRQLRPGGQRKRGDDIRKREKLDDKWLAHVKYMWSKTKEVNDHIGSIRRRKWRDRMQRGDGKQ
jgi:hypothetical protein